MYNTIPPTGSIILGSFKKKEQISLDLFQRFIKILITQLPGIKHNLSFSLVYFKYWHNI